MLDDIQVNSNKKEKLKKIYIIIFSLLASFFLVLCIVFMFTTKNLTNATQYLNEINTLSKNIQRLVKMKIAGEVVDRLLTHVDNSLEITSHVPNVFADKDEYSNLLINISKNWKNLEQELHMVDKLNWQGTKILFASETYYFLIESLIQKIIVDIEQLYNIQYLLQVFATITLTATIVMLFLLRNLLTVDKLSQLATMDSSTNIYNRHSCDNLLQKFCSPTEYNKSAFLLFDLNGLKIVNDTLGHVYGDELIKIFATTLNKVSSELKDNAFVGRYGGDEFIVFFEETTKSEVQEYINILKLSVDRINSTLSLYKISYALGYTFAEDYINDNQLSLMELLEFADSEMYENKRKIKKLQNSNLSKNSNIETVYYKK